MDIDEEEDARPQDLLLLDFSPFSARRQTSSTIEKPSHLDDIEVEVDAVSDGHWSDFKSDAGIQHEPLEVDIVDEMSCIERAGCWEDDVWTGLPYVRIRREMGVVANGVMMDDQRVMMVLVSWVPCVFTGYALTRQTNDSPPSQEITVLCM